MSPTPTHHPQQPPTAEAAAATAAPLDLEPLRPLLHQLAEVVAEQLAIRLAAQPAAIAVEAPTRRLLTLDQLLEQLPAGKSPKTWRSWLYQRTRLGQVPGCHKLGNRLFFDPNLTLPWLLNEPATRPTAAGLDLPADESLHARSMPHEPGQRRQRGGQG